MKRAVWAFVLTAVFLSGALTWTILRGEDTRERVRVVERTVDPCARPKSDSCQRRIRLVLRELVRRHPGEFRLKAGHTRSDISPPVAPGGGGAIGSPPSGNGPTGRVPPRDSPPAETPPSEPPPARKPTVDLDVPVVPRVCVGDLLSVNCN